MYASGDSRIIYNCVNEPIGPSHIVVRILKAHTCALVPPIPNEFTLARLLRSCGQGVALIGTTRRFSLNSTFGVRLSHPIASSGLLLGFGFLNLIFGGIMPYCRESMTLIRLVMPDAPSE